MADVFISYSSEDREQAERIVEALEHNRISCWIDRKNIATGSYFGEEVPEAILNSPIFMLLLSEKSQQSKYVLMELDWATSRDKYIIPVMLSNCEVIPKFAFLLQNKQHYSALNGNFININKLVDRIKKLLAMDHTSQMNVSRRVALALENGKKCPACGSIDYFARYDYWERSVKTEKGKSTTSILFVVLIALVLICVAIRFVIMGMVDILGESINMLQVPLPVLNDDAYSLVSKLLDGYKSILDAYTIVIYMCNAASIVLAIAIYFFGFPENIYELRRRRRIRKHIEVYNLTCNACARKFKVVIHTDQNTCSDEKSHS